jgi:hypothetical protein
MKKNYYPAVFILISVLSLSWRVAAEEHIEVAPPDNGMLFMGKMDSPMGHQNRPLSPLMLQDPAELQGMLDEIGVNKQNSEKIIAISRSFSKSLDGRMIRIQREELNIREELLKEKPDLQSIQSMINKKTLVFGEIEFSQIKRDVEIKSLLSDNEYEMWKSTLTKRLQRMMPQLRGKFKEKMPEQKR